MKTGISTSAIEKAFTFGKNPAGAYAVSNIINGDPSGAAVDMPAKDSTFTTEGGVHNHSTETYDVSSPGDIYWFWKVHHENPNFNYYYTNGAVTGAEYVYTITNLTDFLNFTTTYPELTYLDMSTHDWNAIQAIGSDANNCFTYFTITLGKTDDEAKELAMAFVIAKYGMGVGISKKDSSGNFKPIYVKEIENQVPSGNAAFPFITIKTYEKTTDCNLR